MTKKRTRFKICRHCISFFVGLCIFLNLFLIFHVGGKIVQQQQQQQKIQLENKTNKIRASQNDREKWRDKKNHRAPSNGPCLRLDCIRQEGSTLARPFPARSKLDLFVHNNTREKIEKKYKHYGLLYVKVPKTGSSTVAGAAIRISKKYAVPVLYDHSWPIEEEYQNRHPTQSFLWASIRNPTERALSYLSYTMSRAVQQSNNDHSQKQNNERYILRQLREIDRSGAVVKSEGRGGPQLHFTCLHHRIPKDSAWRSSYPEYVSNSQQVKGNVKKVVEDYDFLVVTDRMEESLVAMSLLMGIQVADVLVFSSKLSSAGQYLPVQDNKSSNMTCVPLEKIDTKNMPRVNSYLDSDEWRAMNYGDFLLHAAASESLNRTIDEVIGRDRFEKSLREYKRLLTGATTKCIPGQVFWPCSSEGVLQLHKANKNCYHSDSGCGYRCVDDWLGGL